MMDSKKTSEKFVLLVLGTIAIALIFMPVVLMVMIVLGAEISFLRVALSIVLAFFGKALFKAVETVANESGKDEK